MAIRAIVFDCDGVLFESGDANVAFYDEVLRQMGEAPLDESGRAACQSFASTPLFERLFAGRPELVSRAKAFAHRVDYGPFYELMMPRRDLYAVLGELRRDYRLAMATNRGKTTAGVMTRFSLSGYMEFAVGVLDVARPKPEPDMLHLSMERLGVTADEAVYVGDQASDASAADAAGMRFVAMGAEMPSVPYRIDELSELLALIPRL
jgi:phosphoglycolate phosphatase